MGRPLRPTAEDVVYQVRNRANTHWVLCEDDEEFHGRTPIDVIVHLG